MIVSVIICTKDRADSLAATLECVASVMGASACTGELLVVDNGSRDNTAEVASRYAHRIKGWSVQIVAEERGGQALARNTGMSRAAGEVIVFTDDDVRPERGWLDALVEPIKSGRSDAVLGRVDIALHLLRPWMTDLHKSWIASTCAIDFRAPSRLVGANMAFKRSVLSKVPSFDENLGPGALGFGDDTLFSEQLLSAGFVLTGAKDAAIEHHCDAERITARSYLNSAEKMGASAAYLAHHWHHTSVSWLRPRYCLKQLQAGMLTRKLTSKAFVSAEALQTLQYISYLSKLVKLEGVQPRYDRGASNMMR